MLINEKTKTIYLTGMISDHGKVDEICDFIENEVEPIELIINSEGGHTQLALQIINTIILSKNHPTRKIYSRISGKAYSAAADIALATCNMVMLPGSVLMFHTSSVTFDEQQECNLSNSIDYFKSIRSVSNYLNALQEPFLSDKEIVSIICGKEVYILWNDPTLNNRIARHFRKCNHGDICHA